MCKLAAPSEILHSFIIFTPVCCSAARKNSCDSFNSVIPQSLPLFKAIFRQDCTRSVYRFFYYQSSWTFFSVISGDLHTCGGRSGPREIYATELRFSERLERIKIVSRLWEKCGQFRRPRPLSWRIVLIYHVLAVKETNLWSEYNICIIAGRRSPISGC